MDKRIPKAKLISVTDVIRAVANCASITLAEATDAMCDVRGSISAQWYDTRGAGLAAPLDNEKSNELLLELFNCQWWERPEEDVSSAYGSPDRWRLQPADAQSLFAETVDWLEVEPDGKTIDDYLTASDQGNRSDADLAVANEAAKSELRAGYAEMVRMIRELSRTNPTAVSRAICEAVLGMGDLEKNPFRVPPDAEPDQHGRYRDRRAGSAKRAAELAGLVLDALNLSEIDKSERGGPRVSYVSIRDWVVREEATYVKWYANSHRLGGSALGGPDWPPEVWQHPDFIVDHFEAVAEHLSITLFQVCELVYHGVPLYRKREDSMYKQVEDYEDDHIYLSKIGEHGGVSEAWRLPYWAHEYHLNEDHLTAYRIFFSTSDAPTPDQVVALKRAFRRHIGCTSEWSDGGREAAPVGASPRPSGGRKAVASTRERNSLLRIIGAMLIDKYSNDMGNGNGHYKLAGSLSSALQQAGMTLGEDTIAKHLKAAKDATNGSSDGS